MKMRNAIALLIVTALLNGCVTAAKEVFYTARGAEGKYTEVQPVGSLAAYDAFVVESFSNELAGVASSKLVGMIRDKTASRLAAETVLTPSGAKTLTIRGKVVYLDRQGMGSAMLGPMEEVVCHVRLIGASGKMLGWGAVLGRNKSRVRGAAAGEDEIADGVAKGVVKWLTEKGVEKKPEEPGT